MRLNKQTSSPRPALALWPGLLLAALFLAAAFLAPPLRAQTIAMVRPMPQAIDVAQGDFATVEIWVENARDLFGIDVNLTFDPAMIEIIDADPNDSGVQMIPGPMPQPDFIAVNRADNAAGTARYVTTQVGSTPAASGSGVVFSFRVRGLATSQSSLNVVKVEMSDRNGFLLAVNTGSATVTVRPGAPGNVTPSPTPLPPPNATPIPGPIIRTPVPGPGATTPGATAPGATAVPNPTQPSQNPLPGATAQPDNPAQPAPGASPIATAQPGAEAQPPPAASANQTTGNQTVGNAEQEAGGQELSAEESSAAPADAPARVESAATPLVDPLDVQAGLIGGNDAPAEVAAESAALPAVIGGSSAPAAGQSSPAASAETPASAGSGAAVGFIIAAVIILAGAAFFVARLRRNRA